MKIAIRGGHSLDIRGAKGIIDEVDEDRKITAKTVEYLKHLGHDVLDVTPEKSGSSASDLSIPVDIVNRWGADIFASIHINAGGGRGSEVLYISDKGNKIATNVVNKLTGLGFVNRGPKKDVRGLYEFKYCVCPNVIVEVCFCDSADDCLLYKKIGVDSIAKAIAEGLVGQVAVKSSTCNYVLKIGSKGEPVKSMQSKLISLGFSLGTADGDFGPKTLKAVKLYQQSVGLVVDGEVGPNTLSKLFN